MAVDLLPRQEDKQVLVAEAGKWFCVTKEKSSSHNGIVMKFCFVTVNLPFLTICENPT
jgi:hypothetical protein